MLQRLGILIAMLSMAFAGGSPVIPGILVVVGAALVLIGARIEEVDE